MRIAVAAAGPELDAKVDKLFGRCNFFIFVDPDSMQFESVNNAALTVSSGAGIPAAMLVANKGAKAVMAGEIGPTAVEALKDLGVAVFSGVDGTVREAVEIYKAGKLEPHSDSTVQRGYGLQKNG